MRRWVFIRRLPRSSLPSDDTDGFGLPAAGSSNCGFRSASRDPAVVAFRKTKLALDRARDPDSSAAPVDRFRRTREQLERAEIGRAARTCRCHEINPVETQINVECLTELARTVGESVALRDGRSGCRSRTRLAHRADPFDRFDCTHEHGLTASATPGDDVQTTRAMNAIDVRDPGALEHRSVAFGSASEGMTGRVVGQVGFGLHDPPGPYSRCVATNQQAAEQCRRGLLRSASEQADQ